MKFGGEALVDGAFGIEIGFSVVLIIVMSDE